MAYLASKLTTLALEKSNPSTILHEFNSFVRSYDSEIQNVIVELLQSFQPMNNIGKRIRFKLISRYQVSSAVRDLLLSANTSDKVFALKCNWFFTLLDDPSEFVNGFIPALSFVTRIKVINKLALNVQNVETAELLYEAIKKRYGIRAAITLLRACGKEFVQKELPTVKIVVPPQIIIALYKKYPSLIIDYIYYILSDKFLQINMRSKILGIYTSVFTKLSTTDLNTFLDIFEKHHDRFPRMQLGRRPTKMLIKLRCDTVINNYSKYSAILLDKIFLTRLSSDQIKKLYVTAILPAQISDFLDLSRWSEGYLMLSNFKEPSRSDIFLSSFFLKYNRESFSNELLDKLDGIWVEYLPQDVKNTWVQRKLLTTVKVDEEAEYISFLPVEQSVPHLKKLIESQSDSKIRAIIAKYLMRTLKINQDYKGIKDMFVYFVRRFRNEIAKFREGVINEMSTYEKLLLKMDMVDWVPVNEFINIIKLNSELPYVMYNLRQVLFKQIQAAFVQGVDPGPYLKNYLNLEWSESKDLNYYTFIVCQDTPYHKICLEWFLTEIPQLEWTKPENKLNSGLLLLEVVCEFNRKHISSQVELPEWLIQMGIDVINGTDTNGNSYRVTSSLKKIPGRSVLNRILYELIPKRIESDIICYMLEKDPEMVLSKGHLILKNALNDYNFMNNYQTFFNRCRFYENFGIPKEFTNLCRMVLNQEAKFDDGDGCNLNECEYQSSAIHILSILLAPEEFLELCLKYVPLKMEVDEYTDEIQRVYKIQQAICKSFVKVDNPSATLPVLRKFAGGDFLKLTTGSLAGVCSQIPENTMLPLLAEIMDCSVSLRKHLLRLIYIISPKEKSAEMFTDMFKTEKNASLRLLLFKKIQNNFFVEPNENTFNVLKSFIQQLTTEDKEVLKTLVEIGRIDYTLISLYVEFLWQLMDSDLLSVLPDGKNKIVELINENTLPYLNESFCDSVLTYELTRSFLKPCSSDFLFLYLLYSPSSSLQSERWGKIKPAFISMIEDDWDKHKLCTGRVFKTRYIVKTFIKEICSITQCKDNFLINPSNLLTEIKQTFSSLIKPVDFLEESVTLDLHILFLAHRKDSPSYVPSVAQLCNSYFENSTFDDFLIDCFSGIIPALNRNKVAHELITHYVNPSCHVLALKLLDTNITEETDSLLYTDIIKLLSSSTHPKVQVHTNTFFAALQSSIL